MADETVQAAPAAQVATAAPTKIQEVKRKMKLTGTVKRVELYGAFVDVGVGVDAIIHVSQMGQGSKRVADTLTAGDTTEVWVDKVDAERGQIIVTMVEPLAVEWSDLADGQVYTGKVTRLENFGAFINIGAEKEGLVHVSEIGHDFIRHPSQAISVGDEVEVKVLSSSKRKRRINLSMKALIEAPAASAKQVSAKAEEIQEFEEEEQEIMPTAMEMALRRAMGNDAPDLGPRIRGRGRNKQARRRERRMKQQEDIISRTLEMTGNQ